MKRNVCFLVASKIIITLSNTTLVSVQTIDTVRLENPFLRFQFKRNAWVGGEIRK